MKGEIFANVWQTDRVAVISPSTGRVTSWIDLHGLLDPRERPADGRAQRHRLRRQRRSPLRHRQAVAAHLRDPGRAPVTWTALLLMLLVHGITAQAPVRRDARRSGRRSADRPHRASPRDRACPGAGMRAPAPTCCGRSPCQASPTPAPSSGEIGCSSRARSAAAATPPSSLASTARGRHPRTARCSAGS